MKSCFWDNVFFCRISYKNPSDSDNRVGKQGECYCVKVKGWVKIEMFCCSL